MSKTLFLDESGDHNLIKISDDYQILCLTGCLFDDNEYSGICINKIDRFKNKYFHTTDIILVSRKIRKHLDEFRILDDDTIKQEFYNDLNNLIKTLNFRILSCVILKQEHKSQYGEHAWDPYSLGLQFILERLVINYGNSTEIKIIAESRGKKEDTDLKNAFFDLKKNHGNLYSYDFDNIKSIWTEKKENNDDGIQIADLCSYPIGRKVLNPKNSSMAFDLLFPKIIHCEKDQSTKILGCGLKIFPRPSAEHRTLWG